MYYVHPTYHAWHDVDGSMSLQPQTGGASATRKCTLAPVMSLSIVASHKEGYCNLCRYSLVIGGLTRKHTLGVLVHVPIV